MKKIPKYLRKYWKPIIFSICLFFFIIVSRLLLKDKLYIYDNKIYNIVTAHKSDTITLFFKFLSFLCSTYFIISLTVLIMLLIKSKKQGFFIALNVLLCFLLNQGMKLLFARERPPLIKLENADGYSFPSGQSMISLAFYGFIAYILLHSKISKRKKALYCIPLLILPILIGISRIYLGVHYASDVFAGFTLSASYLILYIVLYNKIDD